jgi:hypothetical protein
MPPQRLRQQEVVEILRPHYDRLWRIAVLPFYEYQEKYPNTSIHSLRTRANIIHDLMVHRARLEFTDKVNDTRIIDLPHPNSRTLLEINQRILLRFKKLDESKQSRNYPTRFIHDYELDNELPGIPPRAHRMTLGYILNLFETEVQRVLVTSTLGRRIEYDVELYIPNDKLISIADAATTQSDGKRPRRLVRVRVTEQRELGKE